MSSTIANILIVIAALAIIIAVGAIFAVISRMTTRPKQRVFRLELSNQGNVPGRYELKADEANGQLRFQFIAGGAPLTTTAVARPDGVPDMAVVPVATAAPTATQGSAMGGVQKTGGFVSSIADVILSIGYMLPSEFGGQALSGLGQSMKTGTYTADRAMNVRDTVSGLGRQNTAGAAVPSNAPTLPGAVVAIPVDTWAQTPVIDAGARLALELRVTPLTAQHAGQYPFRVVSRMVERPDAPEAVESGTVAYTGVSLFQRAWPIVAFLAVALSVIACSTFMIMTRALVSGQ
ncbi:MAG: hypothetical protein HZB53_18000 [Chloroflexi bacterium]|nr:hypothetical protein [Chloroflexota bacterium]